MAFREVRVFEVREVLRLRQRGDGLRSVERMVGIDRKTVRHYVNAGGGIRTRPRSYGRSASLSNVRELHITSSWRDRRTAKHRAIVPV